MISNIDGNQPLALMTSPVAKRTITVTQDPSHIVNGKLRILFFPSDVPGQPSALKIDGRVYQVDPRVAPISGAHGSPGGQLYFQAEVEPFKQDGEHAAELKVTGNDGTTWVPITLNVLIAMNR